MEAEKRIRREIANSNERRRMQSINAGFQALRNLLPKHEGEKLSKAAILQQTAEYIYSLEQEKTRLLSQNSLLKRLVNEHEGGEAPAKKRKGDVPAVDAAPPADAERASSKLSTVELDELRLQLDRERRFRMTLEDRVRTYESRPYPDDCELSRRMTLQYESPEPLDRVDALHRMIEIAPDDVLDDGLDCGETLRLVAVESPTSLDRRIVREDEIRSRSPSPMGISVEDERPSPATIESSLLEAAIKAEPKVEVETLPGPGPSSPGESSRHFLANTSRQNLETIVEAIRHLEGDHMFAEEQPGVREQDSPLALTNKPEQQRRLLINDILQFHQPQSRPGVIVVKHS